MADNKPTRRPRKTRSKAEAKPSVDSSDVAVPTNFDPTTPNKYARKKRVGEDKTVTNVKKVYTAGHTNLKVTQY